MFCCASVFQRPESLVLTLAQNSFLFRRPDGTPCHSAGDVNTFVRTSIEAGRVLVFSIVKATYME